MTPAQREEFASTHESNFALGAEGIGRFRVSAFIQKDKPAMVLRLVETRIPAIEELNLPPIVKELAMTKRGMVLLAGALKNTLRQAPDVILIGEIRTRETMDLAIAFAETGHLCLSTVHANNANQTLDRVINFFPEDRREQLLLDLSLNLRAVVAQQLIRRADGKGRVPVVEVLLNTPLVADRVRKGELETLKDIMKRSTEEGMTTFDQGLFRLYQQGAISYEDALLYADSANEVRLMVKLGGSEQLDRLSAADFDDIRLFDKD
jgi:twitching motility protein PilU